MGDESRYVAASTGPSLLAGGLNALTPEVRLANGNSLFVFALPGNRPWPVEGAFSFDW